MIDDLILSISYLRWAKERWCVKSIPRLLFDLEYVLGNPELILFYNKNKLSFGKDNVYGLIPPAGFFQATKLAENELIKNFSLIKLG